MTTWQPGEVVNITIKGARVCEVSGPVSGPRLQLKVGTNDLYIAPGLTPLITVERVWPAGSGAPQVGDVWVGRSGTRYAAIEAPGADEPFLMAFVVGNPLRTSAQIAAHDGPLTLAWREGWTATDVGQADEPEPKDARFAALLRHVVAGVDAGLVVPWSVDNDSVYIAKNWPADSEQHRRDAVDAWLAHFGANVGGNNDRPSAYRAVIMWRGDELKIWTPVEAPPAVAPETDPTALDDLAIAATDPAELDAPIETPEQSAAIVDANLTRMGITLGGDPT